MALVRVATFNAHWGLDMEGVAYDLVDVCRRIDADVLALQEAWRPRTGPVFHELAAAALGYDCHELEQPRGRDRCIPDTVKAIDGETGWWGLAVLSRLPLIGRREPPLPRITLDPATRAALVLELDTGSAPLTVSAVHMTHRLWGSPRQLRTLAGALPSSERAGVVMGDFNMWGPVVTAFLPGWRRAVRGRTWPAGRPHSQIDHILVNGAVRVHEPEVLGPTGSDHRPVRATIELP